MKKQWLEITAHVIFWALTTWVLLRLFAIEEKQIEVINGVESVRIKYNPIFQQVLLVGQFFRVLLFCSLLWLVGKLNRGAFTLSWFWLRSIGAFALFFFISQIFVKIALLPKGVPLNYDLSLGIFGFYAAIALAVGFTKGWVKKEHDSQRLFLEKKEAELNLLRSQLHPHFLFNTLNNLLSMAQLSGEEKLSASIGRLSELLRFSIYETQGGSISLYKELVFLKHFIELNLIRFEEGEIDLQFVQTGNTAGYLIEPGILLPFVENAFKFGTMPEEPSFIHIELNMPPSGQLYFMVKNSKHTGFDRAHLNRGGIGLSNTRRRLNLIYPDKHNLKITDDQYFTVELTIDLHDNHHR